MLGLTVSASNRDFHESLHEEIVNVSYVHHLHPSDVVSAFSYITDVDENLTGELECISVRTIGVKNIDLQGIDLPVELLETEKTYTKNVDRICKGLCPGAYKQDYCSCRPEDYQAIKPKAGLFVVIE